jgi:two-component system, OmpR family, sensor histidine kinase AdeS
MKWSPSLQTQLVVAMIICVVTTVTLALSVTTVLMNAQDAAFRAALSPKALAAQSDIVLGRTPTDETAVVEILNTRQKIYGDSSVISGVVLLGVALAAVTFGAVLGVGLARRLGLPLGEVTAAARRVAGGDLKARAAQTRTATGETLHLVENFNAMAEALEGFQRRSIESAAATAHELRTPLTILRGRLEGMREGLFPVDLPAIERLIGQVESLSRIVDDLRIISLAQAGELRVALVQIDLATQLSGLLDVVAPGLEAQGIRVERVLHTAPAYADPDRLRQAALALLTNAAVHAGVGKEVTVETGCVDGVAILRVSDRGPGLPDAARDRIFEPFWRSDASRSRESGGSGLGLSVVAAIAASHGGRAMAEARPGGGASFVLEFAQFGPTRQISASHPRNLHSLAQKSDH